MSDYNERACTNCGSYLHHEDNCNSLLGTTCKYCGSRCHKEEKCLRQPIPKNTTKFIVEPMGEKVERFMALGYNVDGDEIWSDGCCVDNQRLAEAIARNMKVAYDQGIKDATNVIRDKFKEVFKYER